ncbi:tyrosine-type recombinase/integrase, partial [Bacteroides acidifaciens]|uniref:tyrosine-type recombinase/integrase n=1 Tax=Bacteroides acidifaciens TaxID=85831 RepID=UPI0025A9D9B6
DKYPENSTEYLLPIIRNSGVNERSTYRNVGYNINHNLKKIAVIVGVSIPLTLYVARHSWASAAKAKGIPLSVISEGMGHDSEATTRIYL